jgi:hypothetical protein
VAWWAPRTSFRRRGLLFQPGSRQAVLVRKADWPLRRPGYTDWALLGQPQMGLPFADLEPFRPDPTLSSPGP